MLGIGGGTGGNAAAAPATSAAGTPSTGPIPAGGASSGIQATLANLPGYQFTLDQGSQNVLRNQAATGQLNSGATDIALQNYGQQTANQNYTNYLSQLAPFLSGAQNAGNSVANTYTGLGTALNQNATNQGNAADATQVGIGNANASADLAGLTASGNLLQALTGGVGGLLKLGTGANNSTIGGQALNGAGSWLRSLLPMAA